MPQPARRPKFWRYVAHGLFWMAVCEGIHLGLQQTSFYERMVNANLDALLASRNVSVSPNVFVIWVTEDDYRNPGLFAGASPLKQEVLVSIIKAVITSGPKAVGVDFDTSAWKTDRLSRQELLRKDTPIVWAQAAIETPEATGGLDLAKVMGGVPGVCSGVTAYFPDEDGLVREYQSYLRDQTGEFFPSLPFNLAEVYARGPGACRKNTRQSPSKDAAEPQLINYRGGAAAFGHLSAGALLKLADSPDWKRSNPLAGKMVLLGGAYQAARDSYPTPVGYLFGVDILANTVQSRLSGGELTHGPAWNSALGYLEGVVLLVAVYFIPQRWGLLVTILTGPIYGLVVNWFAFHWGGAFLSFAPSFIGLIIFKSIDYAREHRELVRENGRLTYELGRLRAGKAEEEPVRPMLRRGD